MKIDTPYFINQSTTKKQQKLLLDITHTSQLLKNKNKNIDYSNIYIYKKIKKERKNALVVYLSYALHGE